MIKKMMADEKPYLDSLFSIKRFSKRTGIPPHQISQLLNESFHQSFFEFVKNYRIEEARRLLSSPASYEINIEEIAHMVGYNSKSSFNKAFLKITGQTPLSFRKQKMP
jgi:AraC-like DNA-binding protein